VTRSSTLQAVGARIRLCNVHSKIRASRAVRLARRWKTRYRSASADPVGPRVPLKNGVFELNASRRTARAKRMTPEPLVGLKNIAEIIAYRLTLNDGALKNGANHGTLQLRTFGTFH